MKSPEEIISAIRNSFKGAETVYLRGGCHRFWVILRSIFDNAEPFYSKKEGHFITKIGDRFYDITGDVTQKYDLSSYHPLTDENIPHWIDRCFDLYDKMYLDRLHG